MSEKKSKVYSLRFRAEEIELIERHSALTGKSVTDYLKEKCLEEPAPETEQLEKALETAGVEYMNAEAGGDRDDILAARAKVWHIFGLLGMDFDKADDRKKIESFLYNLKEEAQKI